jgi:hypothetical protein
MSDNVFTADHRSLPRMIQTCPSVDIFFLPRFCFELVVVSLTLTIAVLLLLVMF